MTRGGVSARGLIALIGALVLLLSLVMAFGVAAQPKSLVLPSSEAMQANKPAPTFDKPLTPQMIEALLARMSDSEVRAFLRSELDRRSKDEASEARPAFMLSDQINSARDRLSTMFERIGRRMERWSSAIANIAERYPTVEKRLATAQYGVFGMVMAALAIVAAGLLAAWGANALLARPRNWLFGSHKPFLERHFTYASRFFRGFGVFLLDVVVIVVFTFTTELIASLLGGPLGPLTAMVWIFSIGVSWSWFAVIVTKRLFAPDHPHMRLSSLTDGASENIYWILRQCIVLGAIGWLLAGFSPTLGFGFPPAIIIVALFGIAIILILLFAIAKNARPMAMAARGFLAKHVRHPERQHFLAVAFPYLALLYVVVAGIFWLLNWLERGQHQHSGPLGTVVVLILLPILDRTGKELVVSLIKQQSPRSERFRAVLHDAWRVVLGVVALFAIFALWGFDLLNAIKGDGAPPWASAGADIVLTILIGLLLWQLIRASLYTEKRVASGGEDYDPDDTSSVNRLETLLPVFRNALLGLLLVAVLGIILSAIGVDIAPLIASAGILGIAIGFGAQTLVRDIFSGIFFLVDDAFRLGEYIELDKETRGSVEAISIRSLQLRHHRGSVITIPFGELKQITNHTRDWIIYKMSFRMEPNTDTKLFKKVVKAVGVEFINHPEHGPKFIEPLKSQGVYYVDDDSALVMRVKFKCIPRTQFVLRREIYHRLRDVFEENGLHLARRKVEVVGSDIGGAVSDIVDEMEATQTTPGQKPSAGGP